jgi:hypothetical protein
MNAATTTPEIIDPLSYPKGHPMFKALRIVARYWPQAHIRLLSMSWEWTEDTPYGATDGKRLLLNRKGLNFLANQKNGAGLTAFLLLHEALHALLGHGYRCPKMRDEITANIAADYIINAMIAKKNRELKRKVFPLISGVFLDESFSDNKSVEQIYHELIKSKRDVDRAA